MLTPAHAARIVISLILAVSLALIAAGCDDDEKDPKVYGKHAAVNQDSLDKPVRLRVGGEMSIALPENPTTGYEWRCSWSPKSTLELVKDDYIADPPTRMGSGGMHHFVLRARRAGVAAVTLQHGRWWAGGERDPARTVMVTVED